MDNINLNQREGSNYGRYLRSTSFNQSNTKVEIVAIPTRVQARLDAAQTAYILGFAEHDIPILVRAGLLKPLGNEFAPNSRKYFAAIDIQALGQNPKWLNDATQAVTQNWNVKNANRKKLSVTA